MANSDAVSRSADFTVHHSAPLILLGLAATLHEQRVSLYRTTFTELTGLKAPVFPERDAGHHAHTSSHVAWMALLGTQILWNVPSSCLAQQTVRRVRYKGVDIQHALLIRQPQPTAWPGATLNLPVYLDAEVQARLARLANDKGVDFSTLVNNMLRKDIELIEMAK